MFDNVAVHPYHCAMLNTFSHSVTTKSLLWLGILPTCRGALL